MTQENTYRSWWQSRGNQTWVIMIVVTVLVRILVKNGFLTEQDSVFILGTAGAGGLGNLFKNGAEDFARNLGAPRGETGVNGADVPKPLVQPLPVDHPPIGGPPLVTDPRRKWGPVDEGHTDGSPKLTPPEGGDHG